MKILRSIIAFFAVRHLRSMPAVPLAEINKKIGMLSGVHGIEFQQDKLILTENNPLVYWENIIDAPKNTINYKDIINIDYEDNWIFILLRSGYYHRLSKWGTERIYDHLYWSRERKENWLIRWWFRL